MAMAIAMAAGTLLPHAGGCDGDDSNGTDGGLLDTESSVSPSHSNNSNRTSNNGNGGNSPAQVTDAFSASSSPPPNFESSPPAFPLSTSSFPSASEFSLSSVLQHHQQQQPQQYRHHHPNQHQHPPPPPPSHHHPSQSQVHNMRRSQSYSFAPTSSSAIASSHYNDNMHSFLAQHHQQQQQQQHLQQQQQQQQLQLQQQQKQQQPQQQQNGWHGHLHAKGNYTSLFSVSDSASRSLDLDRDLPASSSCPTSPMLQLSSLQLQPSSRGARVIADTGAGSTSNSGLDSGSQRAMPASAHSLVRDSFPRRSHSLSPHLSSTSYQLSSPYSSPYGNGVGAATVAISPALSPISDSDHESPGQVFSYSRGYPVSGPSFSTMSTRTPARPLPPLNLTPTHTDERVPLSLSLSPLYTMGNTHNNRNYNSGGGGSMFHSGTGSVTVPEGRDHTPDYNFGTTGGGDHATNFAVRGDAGSLFNSSSCSGSSLDSVSGAASGYRGRGNSTARRMQLQLQGIMQGHHEDYRSQSHSPSLSPLSVAMDLNALSLNSSDSNANLNLNMLNLNGGLSPATGHGSKGKLNKQADKKDLYKTELCKSHATSGHCTYGNKCVFAHGISDLKSRKRVPAFKTVPCQDPARSGSHQCLYAGRCNYAHPGQAIRRPCTTHYYDAEYFEALYRDFPDLDFPFGVYV